MSSVHSEVVALTDGYRVYERARRGVYRELDRRGRRKGVTCSGFDPRPRWKPARVCKYDERSSLTCEVCGLYDTGYTETGLRSFCGDQGKGWVLP